MEKLLSLHGINKSFNGVQVLFDINLELHEGEVLCLVGENGAGKSTLIKILSGAEAPNSGTIAAFGNEFRRMQLRKAIELGIAVIYQDADLVDTLTVADNVFLGEELKKGPLVDHRKQEKTTQEIIDKLGLRFAASELVANLSQTQKQCTQIVRAIKRNARIVIMDEPTSSLGHTDAEMLLKLVRQLAAEGKAVIYISHFLSEIFKVGDNVLVLKDGHPVCYTPLSETNPDKLVVNMVGRAASSFYSRSHTAMGDGLLEIKGYSAPPKIKSTSFTVRQGEIFGLGGLVGAGRTELMRLIYGCDRRSSGRLVLNGRDITPDNPVQAVKNGVYMIFENRKSESLFTSRPVNENIMISANEKRMFINLKSEHDAVKGCIEDLHIKVFNQRQEAGNLSGGNQQKIVLSRWLVDEGEVYIFDEPTKGVDVGAKEEIYKRIVALASKGKYVIVISSVLPELISLSDRIGIMRNGELVNVVCSDHATESSLLTEFIGFNEPLQKEH